LGHAIAGFVGRYAELAAQPPFAAASVVVAINQGFGLMVEPEGEVLPEALDANIESYGARIGLYLPIVFVSTDYFGGRGQQGAAAWSPAGTLPWQIAEGGVINAALHFIGVETGGFRDAFDAVGLGRYRSNEDWVTFAREGKLHWERQGQDWTAWARLITGKA
jgi:hypothetical protein